MALLRDHYDYQDSSGADRNILDDLFGQNLITLQINLGDESFKAYGVKEAISQLDLSNPVIVDYRDFKIADGNTVIDVDNHIRALTNPQHAAPSFDWDTGLWGLVIDQVGRKILNTAMGPPSGIADDYVGNISFEPGYWMDRWTDTLSHFTYNYLYKRGLVERSGNYGLQWSESDSATFRKHVLLLPAKGNTGLSDKFIDEWTVAIRNEEERILRDGGYTFKFAGRANVLFQPLSLPVLCVNEGHVIVIGQPQEDGYANFYRVARTSPDDISAIMVFGTNSAFRDKDVYPLPGYNTPQIAPSLVDTFPLVRTLDGELQGISTWYSEQYHLAPMITTTANVSIAPSGWDQNLFYPSWIEPMRDAGATGYYGDSQYKVISSIQLAEISFKDLDLVFADATGIEMASREAGVIVPVSEFRAYLLDRADDERLTQAQKTNITERLLDSANFADGVIVATVTAFAIPMTYECLKNTQLYAEAMKADIDIYSKEITANVTLKQAQNRINALIPQRTWCFMEDESLLADSTLSANGEYVRDHAGDFGLFMMPMALEGTRNLFLALNNSGVNYVLDTADVTYLLAYGVRILDDAYVLVNYEDRATRSAFLSSLGFPEDYTLDLSIAAGGDADLEWARLSPLSFRTGAFPDPRHQTADRFNRMQIAYKGVSCKPVEDYIFSSCFLASTYAL
jgi:hypothetical protein